MPESRHLNNPPIVEALVHFQANASERWTQTEARARAISLFPRHQQVEQQFELSFQLQLGTAQPLGGVEQQVGNGFLLRSSTESTVHQVRRDGYSFSQLTPYIGWDKFIANAKDGWETYSKAFQPAELHTLALRFINRLDFPADGFRNDSSHYLTIAPRPPEGLPWGFGVFAHHYALAVPDSPCLVNLNLVRLVEARQDTTASMLLDIEVLLTQPLAALGLSVDDTLRMMRKVKNDAFFHSLTETALSHYNMSA